jgi:uncharacterized membrane protein YkoI
MKKQSIIIAMATSFLLLFVAPIMAADNKVTLPPLSQILQSLQTQGYSIVRKIKFDDGIYKAEVINQQGKEVKIEVNAQTGKIIKPQGNKNRLTLLEATQKAEKEGYHNIYKIEADDDEYEVKALDKDGKKVELEIDATTGKVSKKWFG